MEGKLSPVIIIALIVVFIAVGALIVNFIVTGNIPGTNNGNNDSSVVSTKPVINLSKDFEGEKPKKVTITAYVTTTDKDGIKEIILPDGTVVEGDTATYEVEENGKYKFTANCVNGESDNLSIEVTEIPEISSNNPYIPEGFTPVDEDVSVDDGFVIEDEDGNQYVWIPVESGKLTRNTMLSINYEESNSTASALVNSVAKYYGFYMERFEASKFEKDGEMVAASMQGKVPWTNITFQDAIEYANKSAEVFGYEDSHTALINSYAWDTALAWIDSETDNYSSSTTYGNYDGTIFPTGVTEKDEMNHIFDLAGNVREWTTEIYKVSEDTSSSSSRRNNDEEENLIYRVIRGGAASLCRPPSSHQYYSENTSDNYWGFRMVLYK